MYPQFSVVCTASHLTRIGCWLALLALTSLPSARGEDAHPRFLPETTPWDVEQLFQPPEMEWLDRDGPVHSMIYRGEPFGGEATRVFAYYADPSTVAQELASVAPYPGVVLVHGGGGTAFREWVELWARRGYAAIAMDLAGHRPLEGKNAHQRENRERLPDGGPDQGDEEKFGSIDLPATEQWPYHAVAAVLRGHSLLRSFPEVDTERTAITGISWGGYLTCIAAGVDSRFRAAVPVYGCGYLHENSAWLNRFEKMTPEQRARWIQLWDPSQYLPSVSMPILFVNGTNDFAYPLDSYMKSYDAVRGEKQLCVTVNLPHSHPAGWAPNEIARFIDQHLRGSTPLPQIGEPVGDDGPYIFPLAGPTAVKRAELHVTRDHGPINQRTWESNQVELSDGPVRVAQPAADVTAWFLTVSDGEGAVVSSRVTLVNGRSANGESD